MAMSFYGRRRQRAFKEKVKNWAALRTENQVKWRRSNGMFWP
jgi:hypothetical protein